MFNIHQPLKSFKKMIAGMLAITFSMTTWAAPPPTNEVPMKADVTTFNTQVYQGAVLISDNGSNGLTRTLLSEDPAIIFNGTVNDETVNTHTLIVRAIRNDGNAIPSISFNDKVGNIKALAALIATTEINNDPTQYIGNISIASNVTTKGDQTYTTNKAYLSSGAEQTFETSGGNVTFNLGKLAGGFDSRPNLKVSLILGTGLCSGCELTGINFGFVVKKVSTTSDSVNRNVLRMVGNIAQSLNFSSFSNQMMPMPLPRMSVTVSNPIVIESGKPSNIDRILSSPVKPDVKIETPDRTQQEMKNELSIPTKENKKGDLPSSNKKDDMNDTLSVDTYDEKADKPGQKIKEKMDSKEKSFSEKLRKKKTQ